MAAWDTIIRGGLVVGPAVPPDIAISGEKIAQCRA